MFFVLITIQVLFLKKLYKIIKVEKFINHNYVENLYYKNINIIFKKEINKIKTKMI